MEILKKFKDFMRSIFVEAMTKEKESRHKSVDDFYNRAKRYESRFTGTEDLVHASLEITGWYDRKTGKIVYYDTCIMKNPDNLLVSLLKDVRRDSDRINKVIMESEPESFTHSQKIDVLDLDNKSDEEIKDILQQRNSDLLDD